MMAWRGALQIPMLGPGSVLDHSRQLMLQPHSDEVLEEFSPVRWMKERGTGQVFSCKQDDLLKLEKEAFGILTQDKTPTPPPLMKNVHGRTDVPNPCPRSRKEEFGLERFTHNAWLGIPAGIPAIPANSWRFLQFSIFDS